MDGRNLNSIEYSRMFLVGCINHISPFPLIQQVGNISELRTPRQVLFYCYGPPYSRKVRPKMAFNSYYSHCLLRWVALFGCLGRIHIFFIIFSSFFSKIIFKYNFRSFFSVFKDFTSLSFLSGKYEFEYIQIMNKIRWNGNKMMMLSVGQGRDEEVFHASNVIRYGCQDEFLLHTIVSLSEHILIN